MITEEQIESLFTFCKKHFVKYYDVQVELVDHLANAIEEEMQMNPEITFEKALEKVHQSFGVMGFAPLVAEKQKFAEKQSRKLFWGLLKKQFGWPKILTFFLLFAILSSIFNADASLMNWFSFIIVFLCWPLLLLSILRIQREARRTGKKFLIINFSWIGTLIMMPIYSLNISSIFRVFNDESVFSYTPRHILIPGVSIFLSLYIITLMAIWQTLASVRESLYKNYPEVFSISV
ncbi:MAG: hypothetical protein ABI172_06930 [Ginsengibacter sp.]|jgi:hypothetical protein